MELTTTFTKKGRINVLADGEYQFTVPAFIWYASSLCGEAEAEPEELEALRLEGEISDAYEKALRLLGQRAHGEAELKRKLRQKYAPAAVDAAMEKLRESRLVDDAAFADALAEELYRRKAWAPERILQELLSRGIDAETAKNAVNGLDIDRKQGIIDIISKMRLPDAPTKKDVDRLLRRLLAAGYSMREIREVVEISDGTAMQDDGA